MPSMASKAPKAPKVVKRKMTQSKKKKKKKKLAPPKVLPEVPFDEKKSQTLNIYTKRILGEGKHHVWIHMVGRGNVTVDLVMEKMTELQDILDNIKQKPCLQFTFVFDFRTLYDFADYATLKKFSTFMRHNQDFFEERLRLSYLLLRYWIWRTAVKGLFLLARPTREVRYEIPPEIDQALCNS
jgi:hypothetical protein